MHNVVVLQSGTSFQDSTVREGSLSSLERQEELIRGKSSTAAPESISAVPS